MEYTTRCRCKSNMADETSLVVPAAISSRILLLVFQVAVNEFIDDYDSSSVIIEETKHQTTWFDWIFQRVLGGFGKWDAEYFLQISQEGYKYEQYMAFFPLYPWILRISAQIFHPVLQYFATQQRSALLACGWFLNTVFFSLAAKSLYQLTLTLYGRKEVALISSLLFCFNPASVFMSSLYTESLFSCLQFTALYYLEQDKLIRACLLFGLGCATRSNGIISCGFVVHSILKRFVSDEIISFKALSNYWTLKLPNLSSSFAVILKVIILSSIMLAPFIFFQFYGYSLYCSPVSTGVTHHNSWCDEWPPFPYSNIQNVYWNVGFLRYFELKQMPNFFLAAPMIVLSSCAVLTYCCGHKNLEAVTTLGLLQRNYKPDEGMVRRSIHQSRYEKVGEFYNSPSVFVYVVHLVFMTLFGFTSMHVQVITRFIASASPLIYWYTAYIIINDMAEPAHRHHRSKWKSQLILGYFLLYFFIGTALHCNFYPWT